MKALFPQNNMDLDQVFIILLYILTLLMLVHYGEIIIMLHCLT